MLKRHQKSVPLQDEETHGNRKGSSGTIRSESGISHLHSSKGIEISEPSFAQRHPSLSGGGATGRNKQISPPMQPGPSSSSSTSASSHNTGHIRFPKLEEYAHFHYDVVEIPSLKVSLCDEESACYKHNVDSNPEDVEMYIVEVSGSTAKPWLIRRSLDNFVMLDEQLHRCIFDRRFSHLEDLKVVKGDSDKRQEIQTILHGYLSRLSELAGGMVNCGSVLSWMEMDNRGHHLVATDDSGINTPAIAAAHVIKRYTAQAADEISLQVGDMISVIDMPPAEDTIWWRGKRGFEVGFFPCECVEIIKDKIPSAMTSLFSSQPVTTAAASKKPLMRKHGKLMSFLRTFFSHRPPRNQLKQSGIVKERVFGCDLGEHLLNSGHDVPLLLKSCTEIIEEYGIVHGIYRLSGITSNIQKLRLAFDEDRVPDLTEECYLQDIHSISSLLKMYFRELPNPLLTYQLYDKFADAVRDEESKLLKIHDVVQQLPPPHYRTTEYLMRHLARVAAFGQETEMHSKNLAIVWAPNLLRSKELEAGGGAAALQGVGIQAVVTECLICYCDIIFSDKIPNYGSQELLKGQKKPRPKSLAISTPTRLLSLEEAKERAITGHLAPRHQKFIDVGGGPKSLPSKYHTVLDVQGYKKKASSKEKENKPQLGKKSPSLSNRGTGNVGGAGSGGGGGGAPGGWKSIFSKQRPGSVKKGRKGSDQEPSPIQAKALTEEDVHNWKRNLRSAKSAESLFSSIAGSSPQDASAEMKDSGSGRVSRSSTDNGISLTPVLGGRETTKGLKTLSHKRSLSSDASAVLHHRFIYEDTRDLHSPIDVDDDEAPSPNLRSTFSRGDSTRKALPRRIPSAPSTPRQDKKPDRHRNASGTSKGEHSVSEDVNVSYEEFSFPKSESRGDVNIDLAIKSRLQQVSDHNRKASEDDLAMACSPLKRCAKTPPKGRKKGKQQKPSPQHFNEEKSSGVKAAMTLTPPDGSKNTKTGASTESSPYDNDDPQSRMRRFYSRFHDYAEIVSDEDSGNTTTPSSQGTMSLSSSGCNMQDVLDQIDSRLALHAKLFPRHGMGDTTANFAHSPGSQRRCHTNTTTFPSFPPESDEPLYATIPARQHLQQQPSHAPTTLSSSSSSSSTTNSLSKETEFSVTKSVPLASPSRETVFPAMGNSSPRELTPAHSVIPDTIPPHSHYSTIDPAYSTIDPASSSKDLSNSVVRSANTSKENSSLMSTSSSSSSSLPSPQKSLQQKRGETGPAVCSSVASTRVVRRRAEFIPSSKATTGDLSNLEDLLDSLETNSSPLHHKAIRLSGRRHPPSKSSSLNSSPSHRPPHHSHQQVEHDRSRPMKSASIDSKMTCMGASSHQPTPSAAGGMCKCLSVPSDIAQSLENVRGSQSDILSSVTISELSMSVNSFGNGVGEVMRYNTPQRDVDPKQRRSSSLDSLTDSDRLMTRTLREINQQMDAAFKHGPTNDQSVSDPFRNSKPHLIQRMVSSDCDLSTGRSESLMSQNRGSFHKDMYNNERHQHESMVSYMDSPSSPLPHSDQTLTPTQFSCPDHASNSFQFQLDESLNSPRHEGFQCKSPLVKNAGEPEEGFEQDSAFDFVTGDVMSSSCVDVNMLSPQETDQVQAGQNNKVNQFEQNFSVDLDEHDMECNTNLRQTHRQADDYLVTEVPPVIQSPRNRNRIEKKDNRSPRGLASFEVKKPSRSTSSEEFDEVASPDEGEEEKEVNKRMEVSDLLEREGQGPSRDFTLPLSRSHGVVLSPTRKDLVAHPTSLSPVVIRRHSPRVTDPSRSPWFEQSSSLSPSSLQSAFSGHHVMDQPMGTSSHSNTAESEEESLLQWRNSALFSAVGNESNVENDERISSLCAAGLMSQRARLSRESSNSSLQSPDVSYSSIIPPPMAPSTHALPDIVQSATRPVNTAEIFSLSPPPTTSEHTLNNTNHVWEDNAKTNEPLRLALYHPDEFSMNIQASILSNPAGTSSCIPNSASLPQVHTGRDVVREGKVKLRKSSTENALSDQVPGKNPRHGAPVQRDEPEKTVPCSLPLNGQSWRKKNQEHEKPSCHMLGATRDEFGDSDQAAMEVDNLCNKLVDDLKSPQSSNATLLTLDEPAIHTASACRDRSQQADSQGGAAMEIEELDSHPPVLGHLDEVRGHQEDCGQVEMEEETENCEILLYPTDSVSHLSDNSRTNDQQQHSGMILRSVSSPANSTSDSYYSAASDSVFTPVRKTSFSKIPRPRTSADNVAQRTYGTRLVSPVVTSPRSRVGDSSYASTVLSSSSSGSSSSSSSSLSSRPVRRGSETCNVSTSVAPKKSGHTRRSSDTKLDIRGDSYSSSTPTSSRGLPSASSSARSSLGARSKTFSSTESKFPPSDSSARSRIPLSHRIPSPNSSDRSQDSPALSTRGAHKQNQGSKKPTSPYPKPRRSVKGGAGKSACDQRGGEDVIEVTKHGVRKGDHAQDQSRRAGAGKKESPDSKTKVVIKDLKVEGEAKLVIESQPELRKKIQTVHAKKVSQPTRQLAEALGSEAGPNQNVEAGSCSADVKSCNRAQQDPDSNNVRGFSVRCDDGGGEKVEYRRENKTPPPVAQRKFKSNSMSLPRKGKKSKEAQQDLALPNQRSSDTQRYVDIVGSRSSLDDSILQLAAERHEIFIPEGDEHSENYGYSTGSLRVKRSQRLQSLVDLFEKGSDSNVSESSGGSPGTRHRTYSASAASGYVDQPLAACLEVNVSSPQENSQESDNYVFPSAISPLRNGRDRVYTSSGEREKCVVGRNVSETNDEFFRFEETKSKSQQNQKLSDKISKDNIATSSTKTSLSPTSSSSTTTCIAAYNSSSSSCSSSAAASPAVSSKSNSRPPRYQNTKPRTRTRSESSASECDSLQYGDGNNVSPQLTPRCPPASCSSPKTPRDRSRARSSSETPPTSPKAGKDLERRGSIKELLLMFEKTSSALGENSPESLHDRSSIQPRVQRMRSVSPPVQMREQQDRDRVNLMRLSLEIPSSSDSQGHNMEFKSHTLRLGPKPFYSVSTNK